MPFFPRMKQSSKVALPQTVFEGKAAALRIPNLHLIFVWGLSQRVQQPGAQNSPKLQLHMFPFCKEERENRALEKTPGGWIWCRRSLIPDVRQCSLEWQLGVRDPQSSEQRPGCACFPLVPPPSPPCPLCALFVPNIPGFIPAAGPTRWKLPETQEFTATLSPRVSKLTSARAEIKVDVTQSVLCSHMAFTNTGAIWHNFFFCCLFWLFPEHIVLHFNLDIHLF